MMQTFRENYECILERIGRAAERSDRSADTVTMVAVTKYFSGVEEVRALYALGCRDFAENRAALLQEKHGLLLEEAPDIRWHFIGPLQKNKARRVLGCAKIIHSVESLDLLKTLDRIAQEKGVVSSVFFEVNISGEAAKHGFSRESLASVWGSLSDFPHLKVKGFMGMTSLHASERDAHEQFRTLREIRDQFLPGGELSMGMSHDFEIAIEEGATMVRIGSALFEDFSSF
ncbi:MAG: YggS family pyridoxal phosphate-dependent enzyme [Planctomycetia bacterium]|nr:YggS family pyridoxal phosphate-dependent enzyme [Planctomycetia bacterium]